MPKIGQKSTQEEFVKKTVIIISLVAVLAIFGIYKVNAQDGKGTAPVDSTKPVLPAPLPRASSPANGVELEVDKHRSPSRATQENPAVPTEPEGDLQPVNGDEAEKDESRPAIVRDLRTEPEGALQPLNGDEVEKDESRPAIVRDLRTEPEGALQPLNGTEKDESRPAIVRDLRTQPTSRPSSTVLVPEPSVSQHTSCGPTLQREYIYGGTRDDYRLVPAADSHVHIRTFKGSNRSTSGQPLNNQK